jgi:hypothetical protein
MFKPGSQTKMFTDKQNLSEDEGIDHSEAVSSVIQMVLRSDDGLMDGKQSKYNPKV